MNELDTYNYHSYRHLPIHQSVTSHVSAGMKTENMTPSGHLERWLPLLSLLLIVLNVGSWQ